MPDSSITKKALAGAMKELMQRVPFARISIGDICKQCGMNRKSFYYHFKDKYDLINWIFQAEFIQKAQAESYADTWTFLQAIFTYLYENRRFYRNAFQYTGQNCFGDYLRELLAPFTMQQLAESPMDAENRAFFAEFFTEAFVSATQRWLCGEQVMEPDKFTRLLRASITGLAERVLREEKAAMN